MSDEIRFPDDEPQVGSMTLHCPSCSAELPVLMEAQQKIERVGELEVEVKRLTGMDNCEQGQGWLSKDVECRRDGISGPTCHKHTYEALVEAQAHLRDAQDTVRRMTTALEAEVVAGHKWDEQMANLDGQVAALVKALCPDRGCALCIQQIESDGSWTHESTCLLANLPAASKAILAAAEREPGLKAEIKELRKELQDAESTHG